MSTNLLTPPEAAEALDALSATTGRMAQSRGDGTAIGARLELAHQWVKSMNDALDAGASWREVAIAAGINSEETESK